MKHTEVRTPARSARPGRRFRSTHHARDSRATTIVRSTCNRLPRARRRLDARRRRGDGVVARKGGGDNGTTWAAARRRALQDELRRWHPGTFVARFSGALRGLSTTIDDILAGVKRVSQCLTELLHAEPKGARQFLSVCSYRVHFLKFDHHHNYTRHSRGVAQPVLGQGLRQQSDELQRRPRRCFVQSMPRQHRLDGCRGAAPCGGAHEVLEHRSKQGLQRERVAASPRRGLEDDQRTHKHLQEKTATPFTCGACRACLAPPPRVAPKRATSASVLAVELLNSTYNGLLGAFSRFGVPGEVVHAACADRVGEAREPVGIDAGTESRGISKGGVRVPQTTVDALWAARPGGGEGVSILSVDTEGWDPLVLRGAASLLQQRLVGVLEFEYHVVGPWATTDLREVLGWLRQTGGYHCYWQSNCAPRLKTHSNMIRAAPVQRPAFVVPRAARSTLPAHRADGVLAPALTEPECQFPRSWSNMVCASAPELRAALDGLTRGVSLDMLDDCAATAGGKHLVNAAKKRVHANHSALGLL